MTAEELLDDLARLLREGLVYVDLPHDDATPRFGLTPRGREQSSAERLFRDRPPVEPGQEGTAP
jgi:hypothetical protein